MMFSFFWPPQCSKSTAILDEKYETPRKKEGEQGWRRCKRCWDTIMVSTSSVCYLCTETHFPLLVQTVVQFGFCFRGRAAGVKNRRLYFFFFLTTLSPPFPLLFFLSCTCTAVNRIFMREVNSCVKLSLGCRVRRCVVW